MRRLSGFLLLAAPILAVAIVGCQPRERSTHPTPAAAIPIDVTEVDAEAIDAAVKERKGKVVLIDVWATWCPPCVKNFPHLVELHHKYADKGLACMSVSLDERGRTGASYKEDVRNFLTKHNATFPNFILTRNEKSRDYLIHEFGYGGSIPFMVMFDKSGKKVWDREQDDLSDKELDKLIQAELAK